MVSNMAREVTKSKPVGKKLNEVVKRGREVAGAIGLKENKGKEKDAESKRDGRKS